MTYSLNPIVLLPKEWNRTPLMNKTKEQLQWTPVLLYCDLWIFHHSLSTWTIATSHWLLAFLVWSATTLPVAQVAITWRFGCDYTEPRITFMLHAGADGGKRVIKRPKLSLRSWFANMAAPVESVRATFSSRHVKLFPARLYSERLRWWSASANGRL